MTAAQVPVVAWLATLYTDSHSDTWVATVYTIHLIGSACADISTQGVPCAAGYAAAYYTCCTWCCQQLSLWLHPLGHASSALVSAGTMSGSSSK